MGEVAEGALLLPLPGVVSTFVMILKLQKICSNKCPSCRGDAQVAKKNIIEALDTYALCIAERHGLFP